MNFVSTRIITADVARLVAFYETLTGVPAAWVAPEFAEIGTGPAVLAIGGPAAVDLLAPGAARPGANRSAILEFLVDDVDGAHRRLTAAEVVAEPTTMPWGNRSMLLRDPDGNLVNVFTPVSAAAVARWEPAMRTASAACRTQG